MKKKPEKIKSLYDVLKKQTANRFSCAPSKVSDSLICAELRTINYDTNIKLPEAMKTLRAELKKKDYRRSWVANIAMAYFDNEAQYRRETGKKVLNREDKHKVANRAAEYFIALLCDEFKTPEGR